MHELCLLYGRVFDRTSFLCSCFHLLSICFSCVRFTICYRILSATAMNNSQMLQFRSPFSLDLLNASIKLSFECWQTNCLHKSHSVSLCIMDFRIAFSKLCSFFSHFQSNALHFWWFQLNLTQFDTVECSVFSKSHFLFRSERQFDLI